jgi:hypothetical protein
VEWGSTKVRRKTREHGRDHGAAEYFDVLGHCIGEEDSKSFDLGFIMLCIL